MCIVFNTWLPHIHVPLPSFLPPNFGQRMEGGREGGKRRFCPPQINDVLPHLTSVWYVLVMLGDTCGDLKKKIRGDVKKIIQALHQLNTFLEEW